MYSILRNNTLRRRSLTVFVALFLAVLAFMAISVVLTVNSSVSLGGLVSEKLLGRDGVADSSLLLGRSGIDTELSVLGFAPVVSTQTVGSSGLAGGTTTAVLRGTVTDMNGLPTATGYFLWGYDASALVNTSATFAITGTGAYSQAITGFNENDRIYYQFVTDADGTAYGSITNFVSKSGAGGFLLKTLLRVVLAASILVTVLMLSRAGGFVVMLVAAIIGLIAFGIVDAFIISML